MRNSNEKAYFEGYAWAFEPIGSMKEVAPRGGRVDQRGRPGLVGPNPRKNSNGSLIFEFQRCSEFGKTWRYSTRRV
jgi:hypothetical protein